MGDKGEVYLSSYHLNCVAYDYDICSLLLSANLINECFWNLAK
jgi:hypothetical protein